MRDLAGGFESGGCLWSGRRILFGRLRMSGTGGAEAKKAGGTVLAQDEATSVVYGMPRAVAEMGLADTVKPLPEWHRLWRLWWAPAAEAPRGSGGSMHASPPGPAARRAGKPKPMRRPVVAAFRR